MRCVALGPGSRCARPGHVTRVPAEAISAFTRVFDALWAQPEREPGSRGETAQCTLPTHARVGQIAWKRRTHRGEETMTNFACRLACAALAVAAMAAAQPSS